jgi:MFS family permease
MSLLASSPFILWPIAAMISGLISDRYGRKNCILLGTIGTAIFAVLSAFSSEFYELIIYRITFGMFVGFIAPLSAVFLAEFTPPDNRGKYFIIVENFFTIGELIVIILA